MGICESLFTVISYNSVNHGQISVQSQLVFEQLINVFVVMTFVFYNGVLNEQYKLQRNILRENIVKRRKNSWVPYTLLYSRRVLRDLCPELTNRLYSVPTLIMPGNIPALAFMDTTLTTSHLHQKQGYFYKIMCVSTNTTIILMSYFLTLRCSLPVMIPLHDVRITDEWWGCRTCLYAHYTRSSLKLLKNVN
jgi:hypothetical protein